MADGGKKDLQITAGISGVDDVGKAADKALSPWESHAKKAGAAIKGAFADAFRDMAKAVTIGNAITFSNAIDSARRYRSEIGLLSSTAGPVGQLRAQLGQISQQKLVREQDLVAADRGLGRMVYSTRGALAAMGALADQAQATGEQLGDKLPLGATLMNALGVSGGKVGDELGRIRSLSDALGTSGGLLAAEDRLTSMHGILVEIGATTDKDKAKIESLALGLGNKLGPEAGKKAAAGILGGLSGNRESFAAIAHMKVTDLTGENGELNVDKAYEAAAKTQAWVRRQSKNRGMQQMIATTLFGGDRQAGAAFLDADFKKLSTAAGLGPSGKTAAEALAYRSGEAGQAERRQQDMERNARTAAERLLPAADAAQGAMSAHPLLGGVAGGAGVGLAGQAFGGLLGKMGDALMGGGRAVAAGGAAAGTSVAAGGVAAAASLRAGAAGGALGGGAGIAGKLGLLGAAGAAGYAVGTVLDENLGLSDNIESELFSGGAAGRKADDDNASRASGKAAHDKRAQKAAAILQLANRTKDSNPYISGPAEQELRQTSQGDVALQRLAAGAKSGTVDTTGLHADSVALIAEAIKNGLSNIKIENHSESPLAVNTQQAACGLKN